MAACNDTRAQTTAHIPPALTATARRKLHAAKEEYQTPHGYTPMGYKKVHVGGGETLRMRPMPALGSITPQADLYEFSARATSARGEGARAQYGAQDLEPLAVSETEEAAPYRALAADQKGASASVVATPPAPARPPRRRLRRAAPPSSSST